MHADNKNPGQGATGYPSEGHKDAGKLNGIGRNRLFHTRTRVFVGRHFCLPTKTVLETYRLYFGATPRNLSQT